MIDIDQLDAQLEQALTDELRMLRGVPHRTAATPAQPAASVSPPVVAAAPPVVPAGPWVITATPPPPPPPPPRIPKPAFPAAPHTVGFEEPQPVASAPRRPARAPAAPAAPAVTPSRGNPRDALRSAAAMVATRSYIAEDEASRVTALLAQGKLAEADALVAQPSAPATLAATWRVMRAILHGREQDARSALDAVRHTGPDEAAWTQRLWIALTFGGEDEQFKVLELCRERAYRYDDLAWRGALTLTLARLGRTDEAVREMDTTAARLDLVRAENRADILTNLTESAFLLGDRRHAARLGSALASLSEPVVVVGQSWVCKGSLARYRALAAATAGKGREADQQFDVASGTHRAMDANPLQARAGWERAQLRLTLAS